MDWDAIALTTRLALSTAGILFLFAVPLAHWIAMTKWRGKTVLEAIIALPLVLPPTVVGFYLLMAMGPNGPFGAVYHELTGGMLPFSFGGILIASIIFNVPFAVRPLVAGFESVDRRLIDMSRTLGNGRLKTFFTVTLPLSWQGLLASLVLTFAHTLGEFGVVLMVGGNIPGTTRTLSIAIYDNVQSMNYAAANRSALVLLGVAFVVMWITTVLGRRRMPV
ncbi:MAG TPA: molybdate ABC transporter permease subunit [Candidatus Kapabacteria bacterium]|nr:molybdate ABC transporter permease subunit [Candidatus Kapabacteria bacterium]